MALSALQGVTMSTVKQEMESTTPEQALWLQNWEDKKWSDVDENGVTGQVFAYDPVVVSTATKEVHCFAIGTNSYLYHKWYSPSTGWKNWVTMDKMSTCAPVAIYSNEIGKIFVFLVGFDNMAWAGTGISDTFTWAILGDRVKRLRSGSISACTYDGRITVVGLHMGSGTLLATHNYFQSGILDWASDWAQLSDPDAIACNPIVVSCKPSRVDIFIFGINHNLMRRPGTNTKGWGPWQDCSGTYIYDPTAVSVSPNRVDIFAIGSDGQLYQSYFDMTGEEFGTMTQRTALGGVSLSTPKTAITSPGVFSVTTKKAKGVYQQKFYESSTGVWVPQDGMTVVQSE